METATLAQPPIQTTSFPHTAIEAKLREELIQAVKIEASIRGTPLPEAPEQMSKAAVHVDSLVVVSILCVVEPIIGLELSESVVRPGGYTSVENALGHLLQRLEQEWAKKKGLKP